MNKSTEISQKMETLNELSSQRDELMVKLDISIYLNSLWPGNEGSLFSNCYSIAENPSKGSVYLTLKNEAEEVKVFKYSQKQFRASALSGLKILKRFNHPYSSVTPEKIK